MTKPGSCWWLLCVRLPACVRAQGSWGKDRGLSGPFNWIQRALLLLPREGKGTQSTHVTIGPGRAPLWVRGREYLCSASWSWSRSFHAHIFIFMQKNLSFFLDSKSPNLSNNPGEKLTLLCTSDKTLLIRYKFYCIKFLTVWGWHGKIIQYELKVPLVACHPITIK